MFESGLWWIIPLIMIVLCFFMMSGRMRGMCGFGGHEREEHDTNGGRSAREKEDSAFHFGLLFSLAGMPACLLACRFPAGSIVPKELMGI